MGSEGRLKRGGGIRVAECLRQNSIDRHTSVKKQNKKPIFHQTFHQTFHQMFHQMFHQAAAEVTD